jgi:hypothetical protein
VPPTHLVLETCERCRGFFTSKHSVLVWTFDARCQVWYLVDLAASRMKRQIFYLGDQTYRTVSQAQSCWNFVRIPASQVTDFTRIRAFTAVTRYFVVVENDTLKLRNFTIQQSTTTLSNETCTPKGVCVLRALADLVIGFFFRLLINRRLDITQCMQRTSRLALF